MLFFLQKIYHGFYLNVRGVDFEKMVPQRWSFGAGGSRIFWFDVDNSISYFSDW